MLVAIDICNTIADVLPEIEKILGPRPSPKVYIHPRATERFFLEHPEVFLKTRPCKGAVDALWRLKKNCDIIYLSARPEWAREITEKWLEENGFPKGELILTRYKDLAAKELDIRLAVEDAPIEIEKFKKAGIPVLVKAQEYNTEYGPRFDWFKNVV